MAPPPRRTRNPPPEPTTTEPSMPAVDPSLGPSDTDEQPALEPSALARRGARAPVRDPNRRIPTSRDAPKKRSPLVIVLLLAVLGVGGAVAWKKLEPPPPAPAVKNRGLEQAKLTFQEGKNLVRRGQWLLAAQQFDQAVELQPDLEGLKAYLEAEKVEVPLQVHLDTAESALQKNELARAAKELAAVPDTTQQLTRLTELKKKLGAAADQRIKDARALSMDRTKMRELKALAEDVLAARPNDRDALTFLEQANRALGWRPVVEKPPDPGDPAVGVMSAWAGGDPSAAFAQAEACAEQSPRCAKLKEQIAQAVALFKKLESLEDKELLDAVRLDKTIGGGAQSPAGKQAGVRLGAVLTPKMLQAARQKQWGQAMKLAAKLLEGDPGNLIAKSTISDGRTAANELFQRCYVGRASTPEDALPLCKEVVEMLPEGDELRGKAERLLDANKPQ